MPVAIWSHVTAEDIRGVFWFGNLISPIMRRYLAYAYGLADIVFCPSEYTKSLLIGYGLPPGKLVAVSNALMFMSSKKTRPSARRHGRNTT